jgi:hypothetical protein
LEKLFFEGHRVCSYGCLFSILGDRPVRQKKSTEIALFSEHNAKL